MKRSSATFIDYHLRPSKQTERRLLLDFVRCASDNLAEVAKYHYVGMGGTSFYDFHLMHRFLGISQMTSLERDKKLYPRCEFNRPFSFVNVLNQTAAEYLASAKEGRRSIYWFDYDDGINEEMTADIASLGARLGTGGFAFITACAAPPGALYDEKAENRLEHFQNTFGDFAVGLTSADLENAAFPATVGRILIAAYKNAFAHRRDGEFLLLFRVAYADTAPMITVGGVLSAPNKANALRERVKKHLPFLTQDTTYSLGKFNLTERERALFDIAVTSNRRNSKHANLLQALGFKPDQVEAYKQMIRFIPRYQESII